MNDVVRSKRWQLERLLALQDVEVEWDDNYLVIRFLPVGGGVNEAPDKWDEKSFNVTAAQLTAIQELFAARRVFVTYHEVEFNGGQFEIHAEDAKR